MAKVPYGVRDDLGAAIAGESTLFGRTRCLRAASDELHSDEVALAATTTRRKRGKNNASGVLVVTDQRLLFVQERGFGTATEEMTLANMSGVIDRKGSIWARIEVIGAGGITTEFHDISNDRVTPVVEAIRSHLSRSFASAGSASVVSAADEIKKLAELRDAGILTEEEFAAKKTQLLGL